MKHETQHGDEKLNRTEERKKRGTRSGTCSQWHEANRLMSLEANNDGKKQIRRVMKQLSKRFQPYTVVFICYKYMFTDTYRCISEAQWFICLLGITFSFDQRDTRKSRSISGSLHFSRFQLQLRTPDILTK